MLEQCRRRLGRRGLYKCYTNALCLLGDVDPIIQSVGLCHDLPLCSLVRRHTLNFNTCGI